MKSAAMRGRAEFDHHLVKPADMGVLRELLTQTK